MKKRLIETAILLWFIEYTSVASAGMNRDLVPNKATAIGVASAILETYLGENRFRDIMKSATLNAELHGNIWSVFFYPRGTGHEESQANGATTVSVVTGGGQPVIELSKLDAKILRIYFAK